MAKKNNYSSKTAMSAALDRLSRRSMTVKQLEDRLKQKEFPQEEIQETIDKLIQWNYLNDQEYALAYIRSKREKYSKIKTMIELQRAGIDREQSAVLLEQAYTDDKEFENCVEIAEKLWSDENLKWDRKYKDAKSYSGVSREMLLKKKVGDKLLRRGFPLDSVKRVLSDLPAEHL